MSGPPVRKTCSHCNGTGFVERAVDRFQCQAPWWDMTSEPFKEWTCGRPVDRYEWKQGRRYCREHERQIAALNNGAAS